MPVVTQPPGMVSSAGVVLTIGVRTHGDRCAMVLPLVTDGSALDEKNLCEDAVASAVANLLSTLKPCLSEDAYVSFVSAEGMDNGKVPYRQDFGNADHPGTGTLLAETSQVAGLVAFYCEPADQPPGNRMRVAKTFIPGMPDDMVLGNTLTQVQMGLLDTYAAALANGFDSVAAQGYKWYRVIAAPPPGLQTGQALKRTGVYQVRGYTGSQRRRLLPH